MVSVTRRKLGARLLSQRALMASLNKKRSRNPLERGFTLVELLVVVVILGVLGAVGVPAYLNSVDQARVNAANAAAMGAAKGCAAALVTGDEDNFEEGEGVTASGACAANVTYRANPDNKLTTAAVATVGANGDVQLTTPAAK